MNIDLIISEDYHVSLLLYFNTFFNKYLHWESLENIEIINYIIISPLAILIIFDKLTVYMSLTIIFTGLLSKQLRFGNFLYKLFKNMNKWTRLRFTILQSCSEITIYKMKSLRFLFLRALKLNIRNTYEIKYRLFKIYLNFRYSVPQVPQHQRQR